MHGGHAHGHRHAASEGLPQVVDVEAILGHCCDAALAEALHRLEHSGAVETIEVATADLARRRLRAHGDRGTEYRIALSRDCPLFDGAVLFLSARFAAVLRVEGERWLRLQSPDPTLALELGYAAGNLHWRVRFDAGDLLVALDGPPALYLDRIAPLVDRGVTATAEDGGK
jgi:urease accessory protein